MRGAPLAACFLVSVSGMSALGLGRVITRWRGYLQTTTGRLSGIVAGFEHILPGLGESLVCRSAILSGPEATERPRPQASIAAINGLMPTMFMTRVKL
jgi:hypothetical protein